MTLDHAKRILTDLALTIKVHPLALGVLLEDKSKFHLPEGNLVDATLVSNVISSSRTNRSTQFARMKTLRDGQGTPSDIPQLVEKLEVRSQSKPSVRAVVITEHANLSSLLTDDRFGINNRIVITLSGYPGYFTCEWIHMLSKNPLPQ